MLARSLSPRWWFCMWAIKLVSEDIDEEMLIGSTNTLAVTADGIAEAVVLDDVAGNADGTGWSPLISGQGNL